MDLEIFNHSKSLRLIKLPYFLSKKMAVDADFFGTYPYKIGQ